MIDKRSKSVETAVATITDGSTILISGFSEAGSPVELIHALLDQGATDLTVISYNTGNGHVGLAAPIENRRVAKVVCSFLKSSHSEVFDEHYKTRDIELELVPQGLLAERIRGGHIDDCVMGAFQVSAKREFANWSTGAAPAVPEVGGAMDLSSCAKKFYVMKTHVTKHGAPKQVDELTYPATSRGVVSTAYTDFANIDIADSGFHVRDIVPGLTFNELQARTGAPLHGKD